MWDVRNNRRYGPVLSDEKHVQVQAAHTLAKLKQRTIKRAEAAMVSEAVLKRKEAKEAALALHKQNREPVAHGVHC
jgi:hypothetical protein